MRSLAVLPFVPRLSRAVRAVSFVLLPLVAACGGGGGDTPTTPEVVSVSSVDVSPATSSIEVGQNTTLSATPRAANGSALSGRAISWSSSEPSIASVANGVVSAVAPGTVTISATSEGRSGSAAVTVTPIPVARVVLSIDSTTLIVGASTTLTAQTQSAAGTTLSGRIIAWSSTTPAVATVTNGAVTAVSIGTTRIVATAEGRADTAVVTVTPVPVATVAISPATSSLFVGETTTLIATARDANGGALTGRAVTWSSSAPSNASVAAGVVTAIAPGTVTITAIVEGNSATATVTVAQIPVATIVLSPTSASVQVGATTTFTATARDAAGNTLTGRSMSWSSSSTSIATVSNGIVTGVAPGVATITATSEGRSATAQVTVTNAAAVWSASNELRVGTIDTTIQFRKIAIAADGRAVSAIGTRVYERSAAGVWNTTGTVISGSPAVNRVLADPSGVLWATGSNGVIMRRTVSGWIPENTGTNAQSFESIDIAADGSGFAAGNSPSVIYRRSTAGVWTTQNVTNTIVLSEMGVAGSNFAVTAGASNSAGVGFQWNGTAWTAITFPIANFRPQDLLVVSATEAYLVGVAGTDPLSNQRYTILQWNGSAWSVYFQRPIEVYPNSVGLTRCGDGTIYFGSYWGTIYRKQGATFAALAGEKAYNTFATVFCESDNSLWVSIDSFERRLLRFNGAAWQVMRFAPDVTGLAMGANGQAFITTPFGVARGNGGVWEYTLTPLPNGSPVFAPPRIFATGSQAVVGGAPAGYFDGSTWQWSAASPSRGDDALWGPSINQVFAVGSFNVIDVFNGSSWSTVPIPGGGPLVLSNIRGTGNFALATPSSSGSAVQWNGSTWSLFASAPQFGWSLFEVFASNDIVSLSGGTLSRWNGTAWSTMPGGVVGGSPVAMLARSATDIYIFRTSDILYYDGTSARVIGQTGGLINAVAWNGTQAIAAGAGGLVLRATLPAAAAQSRAITTSKRSPP
jgi:uncharacterized protein YjdB